jgi:hypothetical protein
MGPTVHLAIGLKLLILLAVVLVGGVLFARMLLRPRRRGTTPHCLRCDYNLTGLTSDRCPECGTQITPASIVYGERIRRPWSKAAAVALVAVLLIPVVQWARNYNWYRMKPTSWVMSDLQSSSATVKSRAWSEMNRRIQSGSLSKSQESRLIDVCLAEQATTNPNSAMIDHLGARLLAGAMSPSQQATFFKQIVQLEMVVRPTVIAGGSVPVQVRHTSRGPSQPSLWISLKEDESASLDGKPTKRSLGTSGTSGMSGCGAGGWSGHTIKLSEWEGPIAAGRHRLAMTVQVEVFDGSPEDRKKATRLHQAEVLLESSFELLPTEPADYVRLINDPSMKEPLRSAITPKDLRPSSRNKGVRFVLECRNVPVSVAFDVLARVDGREHTVSTLQLAKGGSTNWHSSADQLPQQGTFDLILRSSKKAAMETVDLFEIWQGELIYPNMSVRTPQTAFSGADALVGPESAHAAASSSSAN